jgi:hypothetical protein
MLRNLASCSKLRLVSPHPFRFTFSAGHCERHRPWSQATLAPYPVRPPSHVLPGCGGGSHLRSGNACCCRAHRKGRLLRSEIRHQSPSLFFGRAASPARRHRRECRSGRGNRSMRLGFIVCSALSRPWGHSTSEPTLDPLAAAADPGTPRFAPGSRLFLQGNERIAGSVVAPSTGAIPRVLRDVYGAEWLREEVQCKSDPSTSHPTPSWPMSASA